MFWSFRDRILLEISKYLQQLILCAEPLLITGDFDIHVDMEDDPCASRFMEFLESLGLEQHVHEPTHESNHTLDLIISRKGDSITLNSPKQTHFISDHSFVQCQLSCPIPLLEQRQISYRKLKNIDMKQFKSDIKSSPLGSENYQNKSLDHLVEIYNSHLISILAKHAPLKTRLTVVRPVLPWFNTIVKEAKAARRKAEKQWRKSRKDYDKVLFKSKRNAFTHQLNIARRKFYADKN